MGIIPDSLISEFKTRHGRIVKDGGGITPDIEVEPESFSQFTSELYLRYFIFDFATEYYWSHQNIKTIDQFRFTDQDYDDFRNFLIKRNFSYQTSTDKSLSDLITSAKKEKYYDLHKNLFSELQKDLNHSLDQDLRTFRGEITELLEDEILTRYFYNSGLIAKRLKTDEQVLKAVEVLKNKELYNSILDGNSGSILTKQAAKETALLPLSAGADMDQAEV